MRSIDILKCLEFETEVAAAYLSAITGHKRIFSQSTDDEIFIRGRQTKLPIQPTIPAFADISELEGRTHEDHIIAVYWLSQKYRTMSVTN